MKHRKIGEKSDVIAVSMATMTFQYGGYLSFKQMLLANEFGDPHFFLKAISYSTINNLTNFKKILLSRKKIMLKNHVYNFLTK